MTEQGIMTWLPTFNKETLNIEPSLATQVAVILMASFAIGRFFWIVSQKIKWVYIASFGLLAAAILVLVVMPMANNVPEIEAATFGDLPWFLSSFH